MSEAFDLPKPMIANAAVGMASPLWGYFAGATWSGLALWWAAATVTTIGYGDVVPTTHFGRLVASGLMIFGFASLSLLSGVVASVFVHRSQKAGSRSEMVMLDQRLAEIERLLRERAS